MSWYVVANKTAKELGLHKGEPKRILDIGCGFGYFVAECLHRGHDAAGLDLPDDMIREANRILDVPFTGHEITLDTIMPNALADYDLITCYGLTLHLPDMSPWGWAEREQHARDILARLRPGGKWITMYNRGWHNQPYLCQDGWEKIIGDIAEVHAADNVITITKR